MANGLNDLNFMTQITFVTESYSGYAAELTILMAINFGSSNVYCHRMSIDHKIEPLSWQNVQFLFSTTTHLLWSHTSNHFAIVIIVTFFTIYFIKFHYSHENTKMMITKTIMFILKIIIANQTHANAICALYFFHSDNFCWFFIKWRTVKLKWSNKKKSFCVMASAHT